MEVEREDAGVGATVGWVRVPEDISWKSISSDEESVSEACSGCVGMERDGGGFVGLLVPPRVKEVGVRPILLLLLEEAEPGVLGMLRRRDPEDWVSKLLARRAARIKSVS